MRFPGTFTTILFFILLMGFECFGCHQKFDTKGPFSQHQLKCTKFNHKAQRRRTNYGLSIRESKVEDPPVAGGSKFPGALQIHEEGNEIIEESYGLENTVMFDTAIVS